jgi:hypothetical protein
MVLTVKFLRNYRALLPLMFLEIDRKKKRLHYRFKCNDKVCGKSIWAKEKRDLVQVEAGF